jgi:hypothetical protein
MDKKIKVLLIVVILGVAGVVLYDSLSTRIDKRPDNPWQYEVEEFKSVDEKLLSHREVRRIEIDEPVALAWQNGKLFLLAGNSLQIITPEGRELLSKRLDQNPRSIWVMQDENIIVAYENYLVMYDGSGEELKRSPILDDESLISSVVISDDIIFASDAGRRSVWRLNNELEVMDYFRGESGYSSMHGFILPSLHFYMAVNAENELWITNPGVHSIQNYSHSGRLRRFWGEPSFANEGFSGCCNPYYIAFLSDGRFVTSEKGIIRVKIYKESGELESVVAPAELFPKGEKAPAIAVDDQDNIWLLDFDKNMLRLFRPV